MLCCLPLPVTNTPLTPVNHEHPLGGLMGLTSLTTLGYCCVRLKQNTEMLKAGRIVSVSLLPLLQLLLPHGLHDGTHSIR